MWTPTTRKQHIRKTNRYQTDLTDKEWGMIEPHLPTANSMGRPRAWPMREIINGIFYVMRSGCPWRLLPERFARRGAPFIAGLPNSVTTVVSRRSITPWSCSIANGSDDKPVLPARSSTPRASRRPRLAGLAATTQARRSTGASVMRWSIRMAVVSCSNHIPQASRIAMVADRFCASHAASSRSSSGSSPTADMQVTRSPRLR